MRLQCSLLALLAPLLAIADAYDPAPLIHEHAGQLFNHVSSKSKCVSGILTGTNSTGVFKDVGGSMYSMSASKLLKLLY